MRLPAIAGVIDRRVLLNYRVEPSLLARLLPAPFRPQLVGGYGIAGICLIRLKQVRPRWLPAWCGLSSENAAHRIAVEWETDGHTGCGVYVPRRDTSSRFNVATGGRLFPGVQHLARFDVAEQAGQLRIEINSADRSTRILVAAHVVDDLPAGSVFGSVAEVSDFFERGSLGYSPRRTAEEYDGLELESFNWQVEPLAVEQVESTYFADRAHFPAGSVTFDSGLLMRGIDHQWHQHPPLCCAPRQAATPVSV